MTQVAKRYLSPCGAVTALDDAMLTTEQRNV